MKLKDVLSALPQYEPTHGTDEPGSELALSEVFNVTADSRTVEKGTVFVAIRGHQQDGHQFLDAAVQRGAVALVVEDAKNIPKDYRGLMVVVPETRQSLDLLAARFFGDPSQRLFVFGVTGTNGKTSCTYLFEHIFNSCGFATGVIGTINHHLADKVWPSSGTTPGPVELQQRLSEMKFAGARAIAMEITSHALDQRRADSVELNTVMFTNLSRDHLDYHTSMAAYFQAKQRLFTDLLWKSAKVPQFAIVNIDDPAGRRLRVAGTAGVWTYGEHPQADFHFQIVLEDFTQTIFQLASAFGEFKVRLPMVGRHNVANAVGVIAATASLGVPVPIAIRCLNQFSGVPGRLQAVANQRNLHVFIDYAHTPDALEKALGSLDRVRQLQKAAGSATGKLIVVFGCGGDRDKGKRPLMANVAEKWAQEVIVTSDNPRTEEAMGIIHDILAGFHQLQPVIEPDRRRAIGLAIHHARPGDILLIAGKGHEDYQLIGENRLPFKDDAVAQEFLA